VHLEPRTASVAIPNEPLPSPPTAFQGERKLKKNTAMMIAGLPEHYNDLSGFC